MKLTVPSSGSITQVLPVVPVCSDPSSASSESPGRSARRRPTISDSAARSASVTMSVGEDFEDWPVGRICASIRPASRARSTASARRAAGCPGSWLGPSVAGITEEGAGITEEGEHDLAPGIVDVGVHERDRLPGAERHPPPEHGQREAGGDERREDVVGAVAGRSVAVDVTVVPWQQEAKALEEVLVAARAEFHHHEAGGGMGDRDVDQAIALALEERRHVAGDVEDGRAVPGGELDPLALH